MAMKLTTEASRRIAEMMSATGEIRCYFRDGTVERVPARMKPTWNGIPIVEATEGFGHAAGIIDRAELYNEAGELVFTFTEPICTNLGSRLELSYCPP